jgi:hypothetical protein
MLTKIKGGPARRPMVSKQHPESEVASMRMTSIAIGLVAALAATGASAQSINLTGIYKCVEACRGGLVGAPAFVTQNGPELNLLNEAGEPSRAWPDWFAPANRIWVDAWNESAVYTPNGMAIQFDNGTVWVRDLGTPPVPPRRHR